MAYVFSGFNSIWTGAKSSVVRATTRNVLHEDLLLLYVPLQTTRCASLMPASQPAVEPWSMKRLFGYWGSLSWLIKVPMQLGSLIPSIQQNVRVLVIAQASLIFFDRMLSVLTIQALISHAYLNPSMIAHW